MRRLAFVFVTLFLALAPLPAASAEHGELSVFAAQVGLKDVDRFIDTVTALRRDGRLPSSYLSKHEAERLGWHPGADLCRIAKGRAIGGDRFANRERRLPEAPGRRWHEADLDYACGARGAKRLLWSSDGLYFVTVDHYMSFVAVPGSP